MLPALLLIVGLLQTPGTPARSAMEDRIERALALARQEKFEQAREEFRAILEAEPGNRRAATFLAAMEMQTGQVEQAIRRAKRLLEADPRNPDLHELLGEAYVTARDWENAEKEWRAVLADRPNSEQAHRQVAVALLQRNRFEEALAEASRALEINPRRSDIRSLRGNILASLGRMEAAAEDWKVALAADPTDPAALSGLAVYLKDADSDRALTYAQRAVALTKSQALGPLRVLALVYRSRGELEQARRVLERTRLTFPNSDLIESDLRALSSEKPGEKSASAPLAASPARPLPAKPQPVAVAALAPSVSPVGVTLGVSFRDLRPLLREPQPPTAVTVARGPVRAAVRPPDMPVLVPSVSAAGITLGASARDLRPLLREPQPPAAAARAGTLIQPSPVAAARSKSPGGSVQTAKALLPDLPPPDLSVGRVPLDRIVLPFIYGDVIAAPEASDSLSLGEVARRLREEREKKKK